MLPRDAKTIKKSRTVMRDSKHLFDYYVLILPPEEGDVNVSF